MAWIKTEAGKREMQTRSLVGVRTQRNLLVLIDGRSSVQELCAKITGASEADFEVLREAGMIEWVGLPAQLRSPSSVAREPSATQLRASGSAGMAVPISASTSAPAPAPVADSNSVSAPRAGIGSSTSSTPTFEPSYSQLSATLTRLVSTELGLRGLPLTLAVERARSIEDLRRVAVTVVARIRERRGDANAEAARLALFGA
ncbi:MAG: hypothetical protein JWQ11_424 [Rhizobacter sp.]|nr:hypothetical protein [Rhizobacter sp.]